MLAMPFAPHPRTGATTNAVIIVWQAIRPPMTLSRQHLRCASGHLAFASAVAILLSIRIADPAGSLSGCLAGVTREIEAAPDLAASGAFHRRHADLADPIPKPETLLLAPFQQHPTIVDADRFPSLLTQFAEALDFEGGGTVTLDPVSFNNLVFPVLPSLCRSRSECHWPTPKAPRSISVIKTTFTSLCNLMDSYLPSTLQTDESSKTVQDDGIHQSRAAC